MNKPLNSEGVNEFNGLEYITFFLSPKPLQNFSPKYLPFL